MKLKTKCIPFGAYPYQSVETITKMVTKLFEEIPFIPQLPLVDENDTVIKRTLEGIPGISFADGKIYLKTSSAQTKKEIVQLDKAYNHPSSENLEPYAFHAPFLQKYLNIIKKFKSPQACINLIGPFTLSQMVINSASEQMLTDKNYRKFFIQAIVVKALWLIERIREYCPTTTPVIILEEPMLGKVGVLKREVDDITTELITHIFTRVVEKLKAAGAIVGVQCFEKCDWTIPIDAEVDIISFDAYNNPNNLCIIPDKITEFLEKGGMINWAIVPVMTESMVKSMNIDMINDRLLATFKWLILAGVPEELVFKSALVSLQGDTAHLPLIFAEKASMLATQLSKRIQAKSR